jgi:hypothetical protein
MNTEDEIAGEIAALKVIAEACGIDVPDGPDNEVVKIIADELLLLNLRTVLALQVSNWADGALERKDEQLLSMKSESIQIQSWAAACLVPYLNTWWGRFLMMPWVMKCWPSGPLRTLLQIVELQERR